MEKILRGYPAVYARIASSLPVLDAIHLSCTCSAAYSLSRSSVCEPAWIHGLSGGLHVFPTGVRRMMVLQHAISRLARAVKAGQLDHIPRVIGVWLASDHFLLCQVASCFWFMRRGRESLHNSAPESKAIIESANIRQDAFGTNGASGASSGMRRRDLLGADWRSLCRDLLSAVALVAAHLPMQCMAAIQVRASQSCHAVAVASPASGRPPNPLASMIRNMSLDGLFYNAKDATAGRTDGSRVDKLLSNLPACPPAAKLDRADYLEQAACATKEHGPSGRSIVVDMRKTSAAPEPPVPTVNSAKSFGGTTVVPSHDPVLIGTSQSVYQTTRRRHAQHTLDHEDACQRPAQVEPRGTSGPDGSKAAVRDSRAWSEQSTLKTSSIEEIEESIGPLSTEMCTAITAHGSSYLPRGINSLPVMHQAARWCHAHERRENLRYLLAQANINVDRFGKVTHGSIGEAISMPPPTIGSVSIVLHVIVRVLLPAVLLLWGAWHGTLHELYPICLYMRPPPDTEGGWGTLMARAASGEYLNETTRLYDALANSSAHCGMPLFSHVSGLSAERLGSMVGVEASRVLEKHGWIFYVRLLALVLVLFGSMPWSCCVFEQINRGRTQCRCLCAGWTESRRAGMESFCSLPSESLYPALPSDPERELDVRASTSRERAWIHARWEFVQGLLAPLAALQFGLHCAAPHLLQRGWAQTAWLLVLACACFVLCGWVALRLGTFWRSLDPVRDFLLLRNEYDQQITSTATYLGRLIAMQACWPFLHIFLLLGSFCMAEASAVLGSDTHNASMYAFGVVSGAQILDSVKFSSLASLETNSPDALVLVLAGAHAVAMLMLAGIRYRVPTMVLGSFQMIPARPTSWRLLAAFTIVALICATAIIAGCVLLRAELVRINETTAIERFAEQETIELMELERVMAASGWRSTGDPSRRTNSYTHRQLHYPPAQVSDASGPALKHLLGSQLSIELADLCESSISPLGKAVADRIRRAIRRAALQPRDTVNGLNNTERADGPFQYGGVWSRYQLMRNGSVLQQHERLLASANDLLGPQPAAQPDALHNYWLPSSDPVPACAMGRWNVSFWMRARRAEIILAHLAGHELPPSLEGLDTVCEVLLYSCQASCSETDGIRVDVLAAMPYRTCSGDRLATHGEAQPRTVCAGAARLQLEKLKLSKASNLGMDAGGNTVHDDDDDACDPGYGLGGDEQGLGLGHGSDLAFLRQMLHAGGIDLAGIKQACRADPWISGLDSI